MEGASARCRDDSGSRGALILDHSTVDLIWIKRDSGERQSIRYDDVQATGGQASGCPS
jgi:hypothetical protein